MYGWLLCPQMPWENAGMQKAEVFIPELSEGVCQHNQPCPEQPDCTETLGDRGICWHSLCQGQEKESQPH